MSGAEPPVGQRFSQLYLERGTPGRDSQRLRQRVIAGFQLSFYPQQAKALVEVVHAELGIVVRATTSYEGSTSYDLPKFFRESELRDFLDAITLAYQVLKVTNGVRAADGWRQLIARVMSEENVGYRLDSACGVHFLIDQEFERNTTSVISRLGLSRYAAARAAFESIASALDQIPPDTQGAIRSTFDAVETVFRLILPRVQRLGAAEVGQHLKPVAQQVYAGTAWRSANHVLNGLSDWIDSAHFYRHAQGVERPEPPPLDLSIVIVSSGASFLRWLVEIDQALACPEAT